MQMNVIRKMESRVNVIKPTISMLIGVLIIINKKEQYLMLVYGGGS